MQKHGGSKAATRCQKLLRKDLSDSGFFLYSMSINDSSATGKAISERCCVGCNRHRDDRSSGCSDRNGRCDHCTGRYDRSNGCCVAQPVRRWHRSLPSSQLPLPTLKRLYFLYFHTCPCTEYLKKAEISSLKGIEDITMQKKRNVLKQSKITNCGFVPPRTS